MVAESGDLGGRVEVEEFQVGRKSEAVPHFVEAAAEVGRVDWRRE